MRDIIKRLCILLIFGIFTGYLIYSLSIGKSIVVPQYSNLNYIYYAILICISAYIAIFYGIYPIHIKFSRSTLFVLGLAAIIMGKTIFLNDPMNNIYFGDLSCVLGVLILIIGPTNLITTTGVKKKKEEKDLEIIEV